MKKNIELIHLEYLSKRLITLDAGQKKKLKYLTRGFQGEAEFLLWFKNYGSKHAKIIPNFWFHEGKTMESDFLILTENTWHAVDVKNFAGKFEYKNNECWLNNHLLDENFFQSMSTRVRKLQRIANEVSPDIKVVGAMVFINEHCQVEIACNVDFDIVFRNQLKNYLSEIKQYQPLTTNYQVLADSVLSRYKTASPFRPIGLKPEEFDKLRIGLSCMKCSNYNLTISKKNVSCSQCQHKTMKRDAICELARELRYIFIDNPEMITSKTIRHFAGNSISERTIIRALNYGYERKSKARSTYYDVPLD